MKSGYHQIEIEETRREWTAFTVGPLGFYEYQRMPFGLANSPSDLSTFYTDVTSTSERSSAVSLRMSFRVTATEKIRQDGSDRAQTGSYQLKTGIFPFMYIQQLWNRNTVTVLCVVLKDGNLFQNLYYGN